MVDLEGPALANTLKLVSTSDRDPGVNRLGRSPLHSRESVQAAASQCHLVATRCHWIVSASQSKCLTSVAKEVPYYESGKKDYANCMKPMLAGSVSKNNPLDISLATIITWDLNLSSCGHITYW